jgi:hypothetical protein
VPERDFADLAAAVPPNLTLERARRDFRALLGRAALSISQSGYNTVVDLLRTGTPAILVPFEAGRETEQRLRAECLSALGLARIVPEADLTAERLAEAVRGGLLSHPPAAPIALDGAQRSVAVLEECDAARPALAAGLDWSPLDDALRRSRDEGRAIGFWWRDDDAVAETPALHRLLDLSAGHEAPVALAAIPRALDASLRGCLEEAPLAMALVHGLVHANHAPKGEKKAEFGPHRSFAALEEDSAEALRLARAALGAKLLPVFVPPWNRMSDALAAALPLLGYRGVSTFNDRPVGRSGPDVVRINAHIDPIDWRGTRGLVDPAQLARSVASAVGRRLSGLADADEPIGLLTHHLAHDEAVWWFCEALIERLARNNVRLHHPVRLFSRHRGIDGEA